MDALKRYDQVVPQAQSHSFNIQRMEDIWERHKGQPDEPHRHDYYTVVFALDAVGAHIIDFHRFELGRRQVYFVSPGQVHQIIESRASQGYALTFSEAFLAENNISASFINDLHLFQNYGFSPPLELHSEKADLLERHCRDMMSCLESRDSFTYSYIGALLKIFLIECNRACDRPDQLDVQSQQGSMALLRDFKSLLQAHFSTQHQVKEYAKMLHITPDHLNAVLKKYTGKSAKEHIQSRIVVEAQRLLKFTTLTNKEIAYSLGFTEAGNFSQFFKKNQGITPTAFRK